MLATSPDQVGQYIIYFVCSTNMSTNCKNKQYVTCSLMHGWAIPQDNRIVHQIWSDKNN